MKDKNLIRMNQLAGLITENQAKEMMAKLGEDKSSNLNQKIAAKVKSKIEDLPTEMIDGVLHIDFDDIGNLWSEVFEETFGHEYDDDNDQDVDNFDQVKDITMKMISNNDTIKWKFDY